MRTLRSSGDEIGCVVDLISDIALQTNLLAINASVEAARAGKGVAVVAGEVKHLSMRISKATRSVQTAAESLKGRSDELRGQIETFVAGIRAAEP